jgi:SDR family mycofactocin-dependent oxidoreductase
MAGRLAGKVAFITGAARSQGRAHCVKMAREGATILALDIASELPNIAYDPATMDDLRETARLVEKEDQRVLIHQGDVRDLEDMKGFVQSGVDEFGRLDVVVANAGICTPASWDNVSPQLFQDTIDINLTGVWNTVMAAAPHLVAAGGGSIILTSSLAGKKPQPYMVHYTAAKHGVTGLAKAFAAELGQHRIRVNSIHPGAVQTAMTSGTMIEKLEELNQIYPQLATTATPFLPEGWIQSEDIANAAAFLASDDARMITAENLSVDAGMQWF